MKNLRHRALAGAAFLLAVLSMGTLPVMAGVASAAINTSTHYDFNQCANSPQSSTSGCGWTNGNNGNLTSKAGYVEGNVVVQRLDEGGLAPGSTNHTVTFQYDTLWKGTYHAYDFLTNWNWQAASWLTGTELCAGISPCDVPTPTPDSSFPIPNDPNVPSAYFVPTLAADRVFTMSGGTITGVSTPTLLPPDSNGTQYAQITVTFTVNNSGSTMCSGNSCNVVLWFGAHVARGADWGAGTGASGISGSPYHVTLAASSDYSFGADTNQMQIAATVGTPSITITKSASPNSYSAAGQTITYSYLVTNNGNVDLNPVAVTDPMTNLSAISCPDTSLVVGASETCTATYTTTQADVNTGSISNTGTATGTPPSGPTVTATSSLTIKAAQSPSITITKSASPNSYSAAGQTITYSYLVTNNGNVDLNPVTVTDPMSNLSAISCPDTSLVVGASETCTATYTTTQADVNNGSISNTGTATGTPPTGPNVTATSTLTIQATQLPSITIKKSASPSSYSAAGQMITYSYLVTNTGNVDLNPVTVTDPMSGLSSISCPDTSLVVGASETCTATYTTTQADVNTGSISNTGTATGTPPTGPNVTATSTLTILVTVVPSTPLTQSASLVTTPTVGTSSAHDNAAVTGTGGKPTGSVTFTLYSGDPGKGTLISSYGPYTVTLDANGNAASPETGTLLPGNYYFMATYSGDSTYGGITPGTPEPFSIGLQPASLGTVPTVTGLSATDSATVSGSSGTPTGSVTFTLYSGSPGNGTPVSSYSPDTVSLSGGTATSAPTGTLAAGNYYFMVTYSGDSTYGVITPGTAETFKIVAVSPPKPPKKPKPPVVPPYKIPTKPPTTGFGGSARMVYNGGLLAGGASVLLAGLLLMAYALRRRRRL